MTFLVDYNSKVLFPSKDQVLFLDQIKDSTDLEIEVFQFLATVFLPGMIDVFSAYFADDE